MAHATTDTSQCLSVRGLAVRYGKNVQALHDVSLSVPPGTVVALMGVNGAGKTTLARSVTGMLSFHGGVISAGEILWEGRSIAGRGPRDIVRGGISQTLEGRRVFAELTVAENLTVGGITQRNDAELRRRTEQILEMFPVLAERSDQHAGYLSGGEQQMLAIGRALMQSPRLIVLDEPSLGLAPKVVSQVRDTIAAIREAGTSVLLIEQNATMALGVSDYGYVLSHGRVTKSGPSQELLEDPEIQAFYLGLDEDSQDLAPSGGQA
ncbi:ABC-type branched-chain amino acid transport system, ATPase component [Saccharomonospora marina XMU15]|uniref:ABC-type branched-chain amino acid transport system, ATPase component n=1 Tax=Saccharomonospora marina XMU15 TaxID=882083 RepID=H5WZM7_9PSEU|nr:ABC transporter ATP-binding protein [Saccharomonospora marina]EHR50759.1 ABC-type branched-chain amino acid transport system, ATPase component [Saccharomonospora marina XMU15]